MSVKVRDINKSPNEIIRVEVSDYKGHYLINIRVWYKPSPEEDYKPTSRGVAINIGHYEELKQAILEIEKVLKELPPEPESSNE